MPFNLYNMKRILIFFLLCTNALFSQDKSGYQWILLNHNYIDFRNNPPKVGIIQPNPFHNAGEFGTTICNKYGELMFQTGGCYISNKKFDIMKNGDTINSLYTLRGWCIVNQGDGTFPLHQSSIALPYPNKDSFYISFNLDFEKLLPNVLPIPNHVFYHVIDMKKENGLGEVVEKKKIAIKDTLTRGYLTATRHSNGVDWWLIASKIKSNCFFVLRITENGVSLFAKQCIGDTSEVFDFGGAATISPNGKKYVKTFHRDSIFLYDFDNSTGLLSNFKKLKGPDTTSFGQGVQFSANNRYLYLTRYSKVYQFDLEANDVQASRTVVGDVTNFPKDDQKGELHEMRLAPDGKIYIASPFSHRFLSVINRPNCHGKLCDFRPYAVELKFYSYGGLPNIPHFTQPPANYNCDSLNTATEEISENFTIYPNPTTGILTINTANKDVKELSIQVINLNGQVVKREILRGVNPEMNIQSLPTGLYFLKIKTGEGIGVAKILKQ
jgi:Secretion system C-terminal sorting domain